MYQKRLNQQVTDFFLQLSEGWFHLEEYIYISTSCSTISPKTKLSWTWNEKRNVFMATCRVLEVLLFVLPCWGWKPLPNIQNSIFWNERGEKETNKQTKPKKNPKKIQTKKVWVQYQKTALKSAWIALHITVKHILLRVSCSLEAG